MASTTPVYADRIRMHRYLSRLSQQQLGTLLGVSAVAVSKWERGQSQPDIDTLLRLTEIFHTTLDELLGRTPPADPPPPPPEDPNVTVMTRAFRQLTPDEQEKYLAVGKALFAHAFRED